MPVHREFNDVLMVIVDAFFIGSQPNDAGIIAVNGVDAVLAFALYIFRFILEVRDTTGSFVYQIHPTMIGGDPDHSIIILLNTGNQIVVQSCNTSLAVIMQ